MTFMWAYFYDAYFGVPFEVCNFCQKQLPKNTWSSSDIVEYVIENWKNNLLQVEYFTKFFKKRFNEFNEY